MQEFCIVGDYTEDLSKPQNCQNCGMGWALALGWAPAWDNTVVSEVGHI